jgi:pathogenesis-related protein 1
MTKFLTITIVGITFLSFESIAVTHTDTSTSAAVSIDTTAFVAQHNFYRKQVGAPDIHWSSHLATYAQAWADKLAKTCQLQHSNGTYGENIYWCSSSANEEEVIDYWAEEEQYFNHKNPTYIRGKSAKSGHYSQMIWAKSTLLGAGVANCKNGGQIWVCVYDPPGNMLGEKAY